MTRVRRNRRATRPTGRAACVFIAIAPHPITPQERSFRHEEQP